MKTKDITKLGIDRSFVRECERKGLIVPVRREGRMIVNDKYFPREYSDADLKIIWQSYLFRKMGMPFSEIKRYFSGEQVDVRDCINDNIERLENQIEECEATIRFMKYVRGEGVSILPRLPQQTSKASNFTEFINEYIQFIDPNKKRLEFLDHVHSELELNKTPVEKMTLTQVLKKNENKKYFEDFAKNIYENDTYSNELKEIDKIIDAIENLVLLKNKNVDFKSDDAIAEFRRIYGCYKQKNTDIKPLAFVFAIYQFGFEDTELNDYMIKNIGADTVEYIYNAGVAFALREDPEECNRFFRICEGNRS